MKFTYVYIIESIKYKKLCKGCTGDLVRRLDDHNSGRDVATKPYYPYRLIYYEAFLNKTDALIQEKYFKSGSGRELIKDKLKNYFKKSN